VTIKTNLFSFATENWGDYLTTITEVSKRGDNNPLVVSEEKVYDFDKICENIFSRKDNLPSSVDCVRVSVKSIEFIEFKSGFKQRITKENFKPELTYCDRVPNGHICPHFSKLFFRNQELKTKDLIHSIVKKAFDTYCLLEKQILPLCDVMEEGIEYKVKLIIVIDEDSIEAYEKTLAELSSLHENQSDNIFEKISGSLKGYRKMTDVSGVPYFYDQIDVVSYQVFV